MKKMEPVLPLSDGFECAFLIIKLGPIKDYEVCGWGLLNVRFKCSTSIMSVDGNGYSILWIRKRYLRISFRWEKIRSFHRSQSISKDSWLLSLVAEFPTLQLKACSAKAGFGTGCDSESVAFGLWEDGLIGEGMGKIVSWLRRFVGIICRVRVLIRNSFRECGRLLHQLLFLFPRIDW